MNLRNEARGRDCTIRIPGICNRNPETTCGCHRRMAGISGMGMKVPDIFMAWGCSACHSYVDTHHDSETQLMFADGVQRTQYQLHREGKL